MERVTFLEPASGRQFSCLLNPEHLVQRRTAGLVRPAGGSAPLGAARASDDVLLHSGGGRTEFDLDLLVDTDLAALRPATGATPVADVRDLTRPLWDLAENRADGAGVPPVRFFWGTWSVLAVVVAVAERLERFDAAGKPHRSWLRMRLVRVPEPVAPVADADPALAPAPEAVLEAAASVTTVREQHIAPDPGADADGVHAGGETWADVAQQHYPGRPWLWRLIAALADEVDSVFVPPGEPLAIPEPPGVVTP